MSQESMDELLARMNNPMAAAEDSPAAVQEEAALPAAPSEGGVKIEDYADRIFAHVKLSHEVSQEGVRVSLSPENSADLRYLCYHLRYKGKQVTVTTFVNNVVQLHLDQYQSELKRLSRTSRSSGRRSRFQ